MSEIILKVGRRGEIYTTVEVRRKVGIREGSRVRAIIHNKKLIIEPLPSIEDMLCRTLIKISPDEAERISEEAQREEGVYG